MALLQVHFQVDTVDLNRLKDNENDLKHHRIARRIATIAKCKNEIY